MTHDQIDVQAIIDANRLSPFQLCLALLCFLVALLDGLDISVIGSLAPSIRAAWSLTPQSLGDLFAAGLVGLASGALVFGPLADRFGRRLALVTAVAGFGGATLAAGYAVSFAALVALRFIGGFFLGGALPNVITVASEYVPSRVRFTMLTAVSCGFSIGGACGGLVAAHFAPHPGGWRAVLILGGVAPLLLVPALFLTVPESVRFLVKRPSGLSQIAKTLKRIAPGVDLSDVVFASPNSGGEGRSLPAAALFSRKLRRGTALIWISQFMSLLVYYFLSSWMPTVIHGSGITLRQAVLLTALFPAGTTIGAIVLGMTMDRFDPYRVLFTSFLVATVAVLGIGQTSSSVVLLAMAIFVAGWGIGGSIIGLNAVAASFYPADVRGTGVSWSLGIGRFGSIVGSFAGGFLIAAGLHTGALFAVAAVPAMIAAWCMTGISRGPEGRRTDCTDTRTRQSSLQSAGTRRFRGSS